MVVMIQYNDLIKRARERVIRESDEENAQRERVRAVHYKLLDDLQVDEEVTHAEADCMLDAIIYDVKNGTVDVDSAYNHRSALRLAMDRRITQSRRDDIEDLNDLEAEMKLATINNLQQAIEIERNVTKPNATQGQRNYASKVVYMSLLEIMNELMPENVSSQPDPVEELGRRIANIKALQDECEDVPDVVIPAQAPPKIADMTIINLSVKVLDLQEQLKDDNVQDLTDRLSTHQDSSINPDKASSLLARYDQIREFLHIDVDSLIASIL